MAKLGPMIMFNRFNPKDNGYTLAGYASVDSGQLMVIDPCYASDGLDYDAACKVTLKEPPFGETKELGVVFSSGFGDGNYPVWVKYEDQGGGWGKRVVAVHIDMGDYDV